MVNTCHGHSCTVSTCAPSLALRVSCCLQDLVTVQMAKELPQKDHTLIAKRRPPPYSVNRNTQMASQSPSVDFCTMMYANLVVLVTTYLGSHIQLTPSSLYRNILARACRRTNSSRRRRSPSTKPIVEQVTVIRNKAARKTVMIQTNSKLSSLYLTQRSTWLDLPSLKPITKTGQGIYIKFQP